MGTVSGIARSIDLIDGDSSGSIDEAVGAIAKQERGGARFIPGHLGCGGTFGL